MKRAILPFVALAMLAASTAALAVTPSGPAATNGQWVQMPHKWQVSYQGGCATCTNIIVRDTSFATLQVGTPDTTAAFSLKYATPQQRGQVAPGISEQGAVGATGWAASANDTTVIGYLVFQPDSSAAGTATVSSFTVLFDGRASSGGVRNSLSSGWVKADSALVTVIVGNESMAVPIRSISPYGNVQRWEFLRARVVPVAGVLSGAVRVFVRYWQN